MIKVNENHRPILKHMFKSMDSAIVLSAIQGHMGEIWVNRSDKPTAAQIKVGIFVYYAGEPVGDGVNELLGNLTEDSLVIVENDLWKRRIEEWHAGNFEKFHRFRFKKDPAHLNISHLQNILAKLPDGYEIRRIDEEIIKDPALHELSPDFTGHFDSASDFLSRGIGFVILKGGTITCGASSYSIYDQGIEVEIATYPDYRRKGLASVAAAALMLGCLENGLYPSWDAANANSARLAEKLGYIMDEPYDTYYIPYKNG
ncbi:GNAT family N-acetyltransferase [Bacillus sp. 1P06AnD]